MKSEDEEWLRNKVMYTVSGLDMVADSHSTQ